MIKPSLYLLALFAALTCREVPAAFPDQPIRLIVPFAAGGGTDLWARLYARKLSARLGQPIVVENRAGANTQIGADAVAKSAPNGYTLLFTSGTHIQLRALYPNLPYNVVRDFAPVGQIGTTGLIFVTTPATGATSMREFAAQAKKSGKYALGTYATGSAGGVFGQLFTEAEGLSSPTTAYKGESPAIVDLLGGNIQGGFFSVASVKAFTQAGKLVALGALSRVRSPSFPNVPTLVEQGYAQFDWPGVWLGVFAPAKTPPEILERLSTESKAVAQDPEVVKAYADTDLIAAWKGPREFSEDIKREMAVWKQLVDKQKVKVE